MTAVFVLGSDAKKWIHLIPFHMFILKLQHWFADKLSVAYLPIQEVQSVWSHVCVSVRYSPSLTDK